MPKTCEFGSKCYRKNAEHIAEFHTKNTAKGAPEPSTSKKGLMAYGFGNSRKRPASDTKENNSIQTPPPKRRSGLHTAPSALQAFFEFAQKQNISAPLEAFKRFSKLRLVGPFELLNGDLRELSDDQLRLHWRFPNDLPEMQTCAVYDKGRFCLWRDEPNSTDCLILAVAGDGTDHFPALTVIGDHPMNMLVHLGAKNADLPAGFTVEGLNKQMAKVRAARRKKSIGSPIHGSDGPRLSVPMRDNVGYRPLTDSIPKVKKQLLAIANEKDEDDQERLMDFVRQYGAYIQMADDEMDFGMGLEFGHDLFLCNAPRLDKAASVILGKAYEMLGRTEFASILRVQCEEQNRRRKKLSMI